MGVRYFRTVFYHFKLKFGTTRITLRCKQPVPSAKVIGDFLFHLNSLKDRALVTSSLRTKLFFNLLNPLIFYSSF